MKPEVSIGTGLAVAGLVYAIYSNATPPIADIRAGEPGNRDIDASRKLAAWSAVGVVSAVSLIAKDGTVFILGGTMVVMLDWWHRHANEVNPVTGKATYPPGEEEMVDVPDVDPADYDSAGAGAL